MTSPHAATEAAISVVIADDEPDARAGLKLLVAADPELVLTGEAANGADAVALVRSSHPDILLLDIRMPVMDGFDVIRAVGVDAVPAVIFITAFEQFAIQAFEAHAVDYLLKPFEDERFHAAVERAKQVVRRSRSEVGADHVTLTRQEAAGRIEALLQTIAERLDARVTDGRPRPLRHLVVKTDGNCRLIRTDQITWIEAADYYARVRVGEAAHLVRHSLNWLESHLDPDRFCRVHRSALVNIDFIRDLQPHFRGDHVLILQDGTRLTLTRRRRVELERRLRQSL